MLNRKRKREDEQGFALVAVLGFLLLLAVFLTPFASSARLQALLVNNEVQNKRLQDAALAISSFLIWQISTDPEWKQAADHGSLGRVGCQAADTEYAVSIIPHGQLINLNTAEAPLLTKGLEELGLASETASQLASDVIVFRTRRGNDESSERVRSGPKHAPFEDTSELSDFKALDEVPMSRLHRTFSVWAGRSILSSTRDLGSPSQYYTIMTRIRTASGTRQNAAVYFIGGDSGAGTLIAPIAEDLEEKQPIQMKTCEALFGRLATLALQKAGL